MGLSEPTLVLGLLASIGLASVLAALVRRLTRQAARLRALEADAPALRDAADRERRRADAAEQALSALAAAMPEPWLLLSPRGRVLDANPAACRLLQRPREALIGASASQLLPVDEPVESAGPATETTADLDAALLRLGAVTGPLADRLALASRAPDGTALALDLLLCRCRWAGERAVLLIGRDRGALQAACEREREAVQALERARADHALALAAEQHRAAAADRAKDDFLATLGHELRTPLHAILGLAHLARGTATPEAAAQLDRLSESARHLLELLTDLLAIARRPLDTAPAPAMAVDLEPLLVEACRVWADAAARQGIGLVPWIDTDGPALAATEPDTVRRVLHKLIGNAVKFTPAGHVTVRVRAAATPDRLRIEISDTGVGMAAELLARLGQPFERAEDARARAEPGTGIGLALAHRLLATLDSRLELRSQPGRGTTACFELPAPPPSARPAPQPAAGRRGPVLVVDALDDARAAHARHLARDGWEVHPVPGLGEALLALQHARLAGRTIRHAVVDDHLPPGDLAQLAHAAAQMGADAPALLLIARPADRREPPPGFAGCLPQPVEPHRLTGTLEGLSSVAARVATTGVGTLSTIDVDEALQRLRGRPEHLARLLRQFVRSHHVDAGRWRQARQAQDRDTLQTIAGGLRDAAATIGATTLRQLAAALAADPSPALEAPATAQEPIADLAEVLGRVIEDIERWLREDPTRSAEAGPAIPRPAVAATPSGPSPSPAPDPEALALVARLRERLPARDLAVVREARAQATVLSRHFGRDGQAVVQALEDFDYDLAESLLDRCVPPATQPVAEALP